MPFRYQRRINFGGGWGFNLSLRGISTSYRSRYGSVGPRGFSFKTGIPGLTFHQSWKGFGILEFVVFSCLLVFNLFISILWFLVELVFIYLLPIAIQLILWCFYFVIDRIKSRSNQVPLQKENLTNAESVKSTLSFINDNKQSNDLQNYSYELDNLRINESGEKLKIIIAELKCNLRFRKYLKECSLTSYGHLVQDENIIEHIIYADIFRLLSLIPNPRIVEGLFHQIEGSIRGDYKAKNEPSYFLNSKSNNVIVENIAGLNAIIFKLYEEESGIQLYNEIQSAFYSLQFCLIGIQYEEWRIQLRNLVSDPYQELHSKVYNGFR